MTKNQIIFRIEDIEYKIKECIVCNPKTLKYKNRELKMLYQKLEDKNYSSN